MHGHMDMCMDIVHGAVQRPGSRNGLYKATENACTGGGTGMASTALDVRTAVCLRSKHVGVGACVGIRVWMLCGCACSRESGKRHPPTTHTE